jgi:carboxyl-terminal processing protease
VKNGGLKLTLFSIFAFLFSAALILPPLVNAQDETTREKLSSHYLKGLEIVRQNYVVEIDNETLTKSAIQGMLRVLDPHSDYLDAKSYQDFYEKQQSQYFGIGSHIRSFNRGTFITEPFENSPASRAGLRYGDHIIAVDGKDTATQEWERVRSLLLGDRGTKVTVTVKRPGVRDPITVNIVRDGIPLPSIPNYYLVKPNIGYIGLTRNFHETTKNELSNAMSELRKKGAESFILDLRGNGGGYLEQAVRVCDQFLQRGQLVVSVRGRPGRPFDQDSFAETGANENFPLIVLIDRMSASASEIVAGAIQDHDRGLIVGESSFGKGLVQRIFPLNNGGALTLTIAHYYTPSGRLIQRDYSNGSLFEYYYRRNADGAVDNSTKPRTDERKTDLGRVVYGGGGIEPDIKVEDGDRFTLAQNYLYHSVYMFTRELVAGQIAGLERYKLPGITYHFKIKGDEFPIGDDVMQQYRLFALKYYTQNPEFNVTTAMIDENTGWVRKEIRKEVLLAAYGTDRMQQGIADSDVPLQRAIAEMPKAADLASRSWRRSTTMANPR